MPDEQLRMQAVVTDGFTGPLRRLRNELQNVRAPGVKATSGGWDAVKQKVGAVTSELRTGLAPVLVGIGATSLGVGGAIAALTLGVKNFAMGARDLNIFSREIGISVQGLRELRTLGEHFGQSWE